MTDTITKIRVLADDFADSGRTYEGCDVARALNGFADRCEATNPTRSDESELRLTDALKSLAKPGCDYCKGTGRLIMHERYPSNVDRVCTCLARRQVPSEGSKS